MSKVYFPAHWRQETVKQFGRALATSYRRAGNAAPSINRDGMGYWFKVPGATLAWGDCFDVWPDADSN